MRFLRSVVAWLGKFFSITKSDCQSSLVNQTSASTASVVTDRCKPFEVPPALSLRELQRLKEQSFFRHCSLRVGQRYKPLVLDRDVWAAWNHSIRMKSSDALFVCVTKSQAGGTVWRVKLDGIFVFVVVRDGLVVTALPNNGQFKAIVQKKLGKIGMKKQRDAENARTEVRLNRAREASLSTPLPPIHLRPRRNEDNLVRLKQAAFETRQEVYADD